MALTLFDTNYVICLQGFISRPNIHSLSTLTFGIVQRVLHLAVWDRLNSLQSSTLMCTKRNTRQGEPLVWTYAVTSVLVLLDTFPQTFSQVRARLLSIRQLRTPPLLSCGRYFDRSPSLSTLRPHLVISCRKTFATTDHLLWRLNTLSMLLDLYTKKGSIELFIDWHSFAQPVRDRFVSGLDGALRWDVIGGARTIRSQCSEVFWQTSCILHQWPGTRLYMETKTRGPLALDKELIIVHALGEFQRLNNSTTRTVQWTIPEQTPEATTSTRALSTTLVVTDATNADLYCYDNSVISNIGDRLIFDITAKHRAMALDGHT